MKRTRYSEEQIIGILTEHEAGAKCANLCRNHGMSEDTFYAWKAEFGGMTVSDANQLKALKDENARLKKLLAEQMLDAASLAIGGYSRCYVAMASRRGSTVSTVFIEKSGSRCANAEPGPGARR
jgi:putative transposase